MSPGFPATRAECEDGPRPCPWSKCRYALAGGACALDVAAGGGATLTEIRRLDGYRTKREVQVVINRALAKWIYLVRRSTPEYIEERGHMLAPGLLEAG